MDVRSLPVDLAAVANVLNHKLTARIVEGKQHAQITNSEAVLPAEGLDGLDVAIALGSVAVQRFRYARPCCHIYLSKILFGGLRQYDEPVHSSMPISLAKASRVLVGSPARRAARVSSMARSSSSVSGSSETGAFTRERVTGSSFGAVGGMAHQLWTGSTSGANSEGGES